MKLDEILYNKKANPFGYSLNEVREKGENMLNFFKGHRSYLRLWDFNAPEITLHRGFIALQFTVNTFSFQGVVIVLRRNEEQGLFDVFLVNPDNQMQDCREEIGIGQLIDTIDQLVDQVPCDESGGVSVYSFYQEVKLSIWEKRHFEIIAKSEQEAISFAKKLRDSVVSELNSSRIGDDMEAEFLYDTAETLTPEDNGGCATIELYYEGNLIADNGQEENKSPEAPPA